MSRRGFVSGGVALPHFVSNPMGDLLKVCFFMQYKSLFEPKKAMAFGTHYRTRHEAYRLNGQKRIATRDGNKLFNR